MKQKDDATLSLFGDELPAPDLRDADPSIKNLLDIHTEQVIHVDHTFLQQPFWHTQALCVW